MRNLAFCAVVSLALLVASSSAVSSAPMSSGMDSMLFMVGTWRCESQGPAMKGVTSTYTFTRDADQHVISYEGKSKEVDYLGYLGYSQKSKMLMNPSVDSAGGYGTESSPGWDGNKSVWTGTYANGPSGKPMQVRDRYTNVGGTKLIDESQTMKDGAWSTFVTFVCTKS